MFMVLFTQLFLKGFIDLIKFTYSRCEFYFYGGEALDMHWYYIAVLDGAFIHDVCFF